MQYRFKGFSRQGAKMLNQALAIAGDMGQTQAGTGHILLAILRGDSSPAARFLQARRIAEPQVMQRLAALGGMNECSHLSPRDFLPEACKALDFAESVGEDNFGCHNTDAHLRSSIIGRNVTIVMEDGGLDLGEFGRIHFIDWDQTRARKRTVQVMLIGE